MKRILISILSDYLQPNFLLIKEFEGRYDRLAFITTKEMIDKGKGHSLEKALGLETDSVQRIEVIEDDYSDVTNKLEDCLFARDDEYILNITGGTKVIPIAVCDFFKNYNAQFYYVPIGKNVIRNIYSNETVPLKYRLNLDEYFTLYGLRYECNNALMYPESHTNDVFETFRKAKFNRHSPKVSILKNAQTLPDAKDRRYYAGVWFEEYCYNRLKREHSLPDDAICKDAFIYRDNSKNNDNEIDVMFLQNNQLYVFECKVGMTGYNSTKETIEKYQYKLAAIAKDLGLRVESYILTLHKIFNNPKEFSELTIENIKKRQSILGLRGIIDSVVFTRNEPLLESIKYEMPKATLPKRKMKVEENTTKTNIITEIPKLPGVKVVGKIDL